VSVGFDLAINESSCLACRSSIHWRFCANPVCNQTNRTRHSFMTGFEPDPLGQGFRQTFVNLIACEWRELVLPPVKGYYRLWRWRWPREK